MSLLGLGRTGSGRAGGAGNVKVKKNKRGKHCVSVDTGKRTSGFKGKGSTMRFYGCFTTKGDADARAGELRSGRRSFGGVGSRKRRKKSTRRRKSRR